MDGRVIVITGASGGIGAALAELVSGRGARVALLARREKELREVAARCGPETLPLVADVTRREEVEGALAASLARFGHVDVWVNNAGRGITRLVSELTDEDFDEMMQVNAKSALYGMQAVQPHFRARGRGGTFLGRGPTCGGGLEAESSRGGLFPSPGLFEPVGFNGLFLKSHQPQEALRRRCHLLGCPPTLPAGDRFRRHSHQPRKIGARVTQVCAKETNLCWP